MAEMRSFFPAFNQCKLHSFKSFTGNFDVEQWAEKRAKTCQCVTQIDVSGATLEALTIIIRITMATVPDNR